MKAKYLDKSFMSAYYSAYTAKDNLYNNFIDGRFIIIDKKDYMKRVGLIKSFEGVYKDELGYKFLSRKSIVYYDSIVYVIVLFLFIFIGTIFFINYSSFLYNKLYVDCQDDKIKYRNLNKGRTSNNNI